MEDAFGGKAFGADVYIADICATVVYVGGGGGGGGGLDTTAFDEPAGIMDQ